MDTDNESPGLKLSNEIQSAVSDQTATFCCGGSVPIIADGDEAKEHRFDDVAGLIASPRVVLRWDLQDGMYALITYLATHSLSTLSSKIEGLSYSP